MRQENITLHVDAKQAAQDLAAVISTPPLWRVQMVRVLQLIGIFGGFLGGADFLQLLAIFPPDAAAWLLVAGPAFAAGSKPLVMLIGDILDDGQKNDSFKLPLIALFCCLFFTSSCALADGFALRKGGLVMVERRDPETGQTYAAGTDFGANGKPRLAVFEWTNSQGFRVRLTLNLRRHETAVFIRQGKRWVAWPVAGQFVLVDNMPPAVNAFTAQPSSK